MYPNPAKIVSINRLARLGFSVHDIAAVTGCRHADVRDVLGEKPILRRTFRRLMRRQPAWWRGDARSYRHCVFNNFADVA